jgi:hypothetical protein
MPHAIQGLTTTQQRLIAILKRLYAIYGGWSQLARAMKRDGYRVRRQKLSDIYYGKKPNMSLTLMEMENLNAFLLSLHLPGLEALFRTQSLAAAIAQIGTVRFSLGFKPELATENQHAQTWISHWDVQSFNALAQGLYPDAPPKLEVLIDKVLLEQYDSSGDNWLSTLQRRPWYSTLLDQAQRHSIIAVGSPKACHITECLLAMMFGVRGFEPNESVRDLPFRFEYSPRLMKSRPSAFAVAAETAPPLGAGFDTYALEFGPERYDVEFDKRSWNDFGVIVSQRRAGGHVWTVVAGLSGPATFAAAKMAAAVQHDFSERVDSEGNSPVYCRAVKAKVERDPDGCLGGDDRVVRTMDFASDPIIWPPQDRSVAPLARDDAAPSPKKPR